MLKADTWKIALGTALIAILGHTYIHSLFIPTSQFSVVGVLQANIVTAIAIYAGIYLFDIAVHSLSGIKLGAAAIGIWLLAGIAHDGTHAFYVPLDEIFVQGLHGIPESGIFMGGVYAAGMLLIWVRAR